MDPNQFSSHLGLDRNRGIGLHVPDGAKLHRNCLLDGGVYGNRYAGGDRPFGFVIGASRKKER